MALTGLRAKLNAMTPPSEKKSAPAERGGLFTCAHSRPAGEAIYAMDGAALRRMGLEGEWPGLERVLFLDTETTGLSGGAGTIAFLTGVGYVRGGVFTVEQYLMRDYVDEPEMLARVAEHMSRHEVAVTFNGRMFDMPLLESRFTICRMRPQWKALRQLDLLIPSRRLWKRRLGSCRLSVLEEKVLRAGREEDLPGSEAPQRFFQYLKNGDFSLLDEVLAHNMQDIFSLGSLLSALNEAYAHPDQQQCVADLYSMGRAMQKLGEEEQSVSCYHLAGLARTAGDITALRGERYAAEANRELSLMLRRAGDEAQAERVWKEMASRRQLGAWPMIELSKLYEHRRRDLRAALEWAERAYRLEETAELAHRRERLLRKIERLED